MKKWRLILALGMLSLCVGCQKDVSLPEAQEDLPKETDIDSGIGEGAPETEVIEYESGSEYQIGDIIEISSDAMTYELVIDNVSYIEETNAYADKTNQVILIDYTYTNKSEELLLIDSMRFQLVDARTEFVYEPYYFEEKVTAEPVGNAESFSAQIAFLQEDSSGELVLIYQDTMYNTVQPVSVKIGSMDNIE